MSNKWIKNADIIDHTWLGQLVLSGEYYQIQDHEEVSWANNSEVIADISSGIIIVAKNDSGNTDFSDINDAINYLKDKLGDYDNNGRLIIRTAAASKGWTYLAHPIEITTAKKNGCYSIDWQGNVRTDYTMKFYKLQNGIEVEMNDPTQLEIDINCIRTDVIFHPNYDYEIMAGNILQANVPLDDVRVWVTGGFYELRSQGAVKEFVGGINLKRIGAGNVLQTDGRASKYMQKDVPGYNYAGNQLHIILRHDLLVKHDITLIIEYFRP